LIIPSSGPRSSAAAKGFAESGDSRAAVPPMHLMGTHVLEGDDDVRTAELRGAFDAVQDLMTGAIAKPETGSGPVIASPDSPATRSAQVASQ
jgi:hypothetical protein